MTGPAFTIRIDAHEAIIDFLNPLAGIAAPPRSTR